MGNTTAVRLNDGHQRLMQAIGSVIAQHTKQSPMAIDEIVGVLGFCAGAAIISGCKQQSTRRRMRSVVFENVDSGMDAMRRAEMGTGLIIPGMQ